MGGLLGQAIAQRPRATERSNMANPIPLGLASTYPDEAEVVARDAIATNLARHSRGVDRNDFDLLAEAYHPDATVAYGMFEGPARDFARFLTDSMSGAPVTLHRTSCSLVRIDGDRARSESYVIAYTRTPEGQGWCQRLIGGRYLDRHERRGGRWRIEHRTYVHDWNANVPSVERVPPPAAILGRQRAGDPAHALFADHPYAMTRGGGKVSDGSIEDALAKQALHDLVMTYARGADRADEAMLASVFHPDADVVTGVIDGKAPDYARDVVAMVRSNLRSTFHSVANEYYEVSGEKAVGESYVIAHMIAAGDEETETLTGGRYLDRFEKRDGVWKIAHRTFVLDWSMTRPVTMETTGIYETLTTRGGYAPDDPSVAFWNAA